MTPRADSPTLSNPHHGSTLPAPGPRHPEYSPAAQQAAHGHGDGGHGGPGHVVSPKILIVTCLALLVLTFFTVAATWVDLGEINIWIALGIALVKATLVSLFFMHLWWDRPFNAIVLVSSFAFVVLFIAFALTDTAEYKPDINKTEPAKIQEKLAATAQP